VRVTTLCKRLLDLDGINVTGVEVVAGELACEVVLRRRRLGCPWCEFTTCARYDTRTVASRWRGLDLGRRKVIMRARLRRLTCPTHGVVTESVPFARPGSRFTADFEDLSCLLLEWCRAGHRWEGWIVYAAERRPSRWVSVKEGGASRTAQLSLRRRLSLIVTGGDPMSQSKASPLWRPDRRVACFRGTTYRPAMPGAGGTEFRQLRAEINRATVGQTRRDPQHRLLALAGRKRVDALEHRDPVDVPLAPAQSACHDHGAEVPATQAPQPAGLDDQLHCGADRGRVAGPAAQPGMQFVQCRKDPQVRPPPTLKPVADLVDPYGGVNDVAHGEVGGQNCAMLGAGSRLGVVVSPGHRFSPRSFRPRPAGRGDLAVLDVTRSSTPFEVSHNSAGVGFHRHRRPRRAVRPGPRAGRRRSSCRCACTRVGPNWGR
jgi:hypothetical protein